MRAAAGSRFSHSAMASPTLPSPTRISPRIPSRLPRQARKLSYEVSFDVTNTGHREGADAAELYVGESHPPVPRPQKELKGFARVNLAPGATKRVKITLNSRAFAWFDATAHLWRVDPGEFTIAVGRSVEDTQLAITVSLSADQAKAAATPP